MPIVPQWFELWSCKRSYVSQGNLVESLLNLIALTYLKKHEEL